MNAGLETEKRIDITNELSKRPAFSHVGKRLAEGGMIKMPLQRINEIDIDIRTVDPNTLVDAGSVSVDMDLPRAERMRAVVDQMLGNPYFMRSGTIAVKVAFADTGVSFDERMESYLRTL